MDAAQQKKLFLKVYIISFIPVLLTAIFYSRLPQQIVLGWSVNTAADAARNAGDKSGLWMMAICSPLAVLLTQFGIYRKADRREQRQTQMVYPALALLIVLLLLSTVLVTILEGLHPGHTTRSGMLVLVLGLFVLFSGIIMPSVGWQKGPFIKSPWTLNDEEVWKRTHALAGPLWMVFGAVMAVLSLVLPHMAGLGKLCFILIVAGYVIPWIYSRQAYMDVYRRRIAAEKEEAEENLDEE